MWDYLRGVFTSARIIALAVVLMPLALLDWFARREPPEQELARLKASLGSIRYYAPNRMTAEAEEARVLARIKWLSGDGLQD